MEISRRTFLKIAAGASVATAMPSAALAATRTAATDPPNIIFIMADDLGFADLGCYGQKNIKTPNIDRLAAEGLRFTNFYAGCTVCAPSRSVLMTGQHTGHTTVRGNKSKVTGGRVPLNPDPDDVTVARILKDAGYKTGMTGKWGLGEPGTTGIPNNKGFDEWFGYLNQARAHDYYTDYVWRNEEQYNLPTGTYSHDEFTRFSLEFIADNKEVPFFLYIPYCIPHDDYEVPHLECYADKPWTNTEKIYAAMTTRMDGDIGKIMALLKDLDIDDRTIVFFCSDNGTARRWEGVFDSSGPLRGRKRDMYEGGIRTPMIVRYPGVVQAGQVSDQACDFTDILPTLAEIGDATPPANIDGVSILPTILGQAQDLSDRFLYWEFHEGGFYQAVRWRNYKAIRQGLTGTLELYDLDRDVGERDNIASANPTVVTTIETWLSTARTTSFHWPVPGE